MATYFVIITSSLAAIGFAAGHYSERYSYIAPARSVGVRSADVPQSTTVETGGKNQNDTAMEIPKNVLKKLADDFRDWAVTRNPCDYVRSVEMDDGDDCWAFTICANPVVRMVDGSPESDYPVVADANILEVTAEHYGYDSDVLTPLDGDAAEEYLERNVY